MDNRLFHIPQAYNHGVNEGQKFFFFFGPQTFSFAQKVLQTNTESQA
jgi:hypothetical protein